MIKNWQYSRDEGEMLFVLPDSIRISVEPDGIGYCFLKNDEWVPGSYDTETDFDLASKEIENALLQPPTRDELINNDTVWAMFYRDAKSLGEIAEHFKVSIYELSPWLTAPLFQHLKSKD